jgi:energy-coupling factor transporter ATP-binding protein EcfA2
MSEGALNSVVADSGKLALDSVSKEELVSLARDGLDGPGRVDTVMKLFGLTRCKGTWVGNRMVRGISGGERKRLSTVEMLAHQQRVLVLDEISTGLVRAPRNMHAAHVCAAAARGGVACRTRRRCSRSSSG